MVQAFTQDGKRVPLTRVKAGPCWVVQIRTQEKDGYQAVQLGFGEKKLTRAKKPMQGHFKKAGLKKAPLFLLEVELEKVDSLKVGDQVQIKEALQPGDKIVVTGWSKGKGFTGVMKRWGFAGGPRTHGQSDRARAPGSIGQGTDPGRVWKGKKMAGRSGGARVAASVLILMGIDEEEEILLIKGSLPGVRGSRLIIRKVGQTKNFIPLMKKGEREIRETDVEKALRLEKEKMAQKELAEAKKEGEEAKKDA